MPREDHSGPTVDLRREEGRPVRKVLLDDLVAERNTPMPEAPVFAVDVVAVEEEAGRRKRRPREGEEPARQNARAAAEARAVAAGLHRTLEQEVLERRRVEREVVELRREVRRLSAAEERLAAAARSRLRQSTRGTDSSASPKPARDCERHAEEITGLERAVADQQELVDEYRERARTGLRERDAAFMEAKRAQAAREQAERHLELVSESLKRNALDERARLGAAEGATVAALAERDRLAEEIGELASGTSRLEQVTAHAEALAARVSELEAALSEEAERAKAAEIDLIHANETVESLRAESTAARDEAAVLADTLAAERQAADALRVQLTELEAELTGARAAMHAVGETAATAGRDAEELHVECDALVARIQAGKAELADARAALATERARVAELTAVVEQVEASATSASEADAREREAIRAELERRNVELSTELEDSVARVAMLEEDLAVALTELDSASAHTAALEREHGDLRARLADAEVSAAAAAVAAAGSAELLVELAGVADVERDARRVELADGEDGEPDPETSDPKRPETLSSGVPDFAIGAARPGDLDGRRSALAQLTALAADTPGPLRQT